MENKLLSAGLLPYIPGSLSSFLAIFISLIQKYCLSSHPKPKQNGTH